MKKILIGLVLGLTMIALIAMPAFAGTQPPGLPGSVKVDLSGGHGFVVFNVDETNHSIRVNVAARGLNQTETYRVNLRFFDDGGYTDELGFGTDHPISGKGNGSLALVTTDGLPAGNYTVYVELKLGSTIVARTVDVVLTLK